MPPRPPLAPKHPVELLSPAGSFEALAAAVENGADAVYLGGSAFNARKFAANFSDDELQRAIDYAHVRGVRVFVTVNTLVFDPELPELVEFLRRISRFGADAAIVQDLGVMRIIRDVVPDLPVHISTQATVHNTAGIRFLEDLGAERIILARENTVKEMRQMKDRTNAELEQFGHGAMCYCYSGQCLMSSLIGGRSGNRGACAYTCRLPYTVRESDPVGPSESVAPTDPMAIRVLHDVPEARHKHVLSARDMNTLELIPQMIGSGVTSIKLEGRMKRPEYVAIVTRAYRNAIDRHYAGNFHITDAERDAVTRVFSRDFNHSWLEGKEKWAFTNWDTAGNRGVRLGTVVESGPDWVRVRLDDTIRVKDGIEIVHTPETWERGGQKGAPEDYGFEARQIFLDGRYVTEARAGEVVELRGRQYSRPGDPVYKTADIEVLEAARATYEAGPHRRVAVSIVARIAVGQPLTITATEPRRGITVTMEHEFLAQPARSAPLTADHVRAQLEKLGDTPFEAAAIEVNLDRNAFLPLGVLNEARRQACAMLEREIARAYHRQPTAEEPTRAAAILSRPAMAREPRQLQVAVNAWGLPNLKAALDAGAKIAYFSGLRVGGLRPKWDEIGLQQAVDLAERHDAALYIASGMVQKDPEVDMLRQAVQQHRDRIAGVLAGHHGAFQVAMEERVPVVTDWPLNVYNGATVDHLVHRADRVAGCRVDRVTLSPEMTLEAMAGAAAHTHAPLEVLAHGRLTLMTSEYCSIGHATRCQLPGGTWAPCHDRRYTLKDRTGADFPLETDGACRMYILNSVELSMINKLAEIQAAGIDAVRIETIGTRPEAVAEQVRQYLGAIEDLGAGKSFEDQRWQALAALCPEGFTTGHFYRGPQ